MLSSAFQLCARRVIRPFEALDHCAAKWGWGTVRRQPTSVQLTTASLMRWERTLSTSGLKRLLQVVECGDAIGRCSARAPRRRIPMHCVQANKAAIAIGTANLASHYEYPLETAARSVSACFCRTELIDSGSGSTRMPNSHLWRTHRFTHNPKSSMCWRIRHRLGCEQERPDTPLVCSERCCTPTS
jgi:hypothetical protein